MKDRKDQLKAALIVKFGQIGDVIMAIPAAYLLHQQGFQIYWACGNAALPLVESYDWITPIAVDDRAILRGSLAQRFKAVTDFWNKALRRKYNLCATLYYDRRLHILTLPLSGRRLILSAKSRETSLIAGRHHTDEYARVLLGLEDQHRPERISPVRPTKLAPSPLPASKGPRRIALAPGGTSNVMGEQVLRRWPLANYVALAELLLNRGWEVILIGGPEDAWIKPSFAHISIVDCMGALTLIETISVCDTCHAVITHDTGPLHLAGLSQALLIGIFGPTDPATRVPHRKGAIGLWGGEHYACRPCYDGRDFAPCKFNGCMHDVSVEKVAGSLDELLEIRSSHLTGTVASENRTGGT